MSNSTFACPQCGPVAIQPGEANKTPEERFLAHAEKVHGLNVAEARKMAARHKEWEPRTEIDTPIFKDDEPSS